MSARLQLPKVLREQIDSEKEKSSKNKRKVQNVSRKESRKQSRSEKKQRKSEYFSKSSIPETQIPQRRAVEDTEPPRKKAKVEEPVREQKASPKPAKPKEAPTKAKAKVVDLDPTLLLDNDPESAEIARLEKLLGSKGRKSKSGKGIDSLFSELDGFLGEGDESGDDFVGDFEDEPGSEQGSSQYSNSEGSSEAPELLGHGDAEEGEGDDGEDDEEASEQSEYSDWGGIEGSTVQEARDAEKSGEASSLTGTKYVPPHMRLKQLGDDKESLMKVKKRLKGMLNRLTEQNIAGILQEVDELSRSERRHDIIVATTELILESLNSSATLSDSFMVLHAAFVGALYRVMGVDFAAYFVTELVNSYETQYKTLLASTSNEEDASKECANLLVLMSELYVFQVISCVIVFDIIRELLSGNLHEAEVELLLKLVRGCGSRLRQDDPEALKDIHDLMVNNIAEKEIVLSSRSKFMVETIGDLKNNKLKRLGTTAGATESTERLKKFLSGLHKTFHLKSHEPLRFTLSDIRSSETKGKWWVVGAAWSGDPLVDRTDNLNGSTKVNEPEPTSESIENEKLLRLARKQGMNTDVRRSIFLVLMTSEDYLDAFERLTSLRLTEIQQREIIRVLFHCTGSEKAYNPYYTLVAQKLCAVSHSHKVTLQYCLWDFLRELGEEEVGGAEVVKSFSGRNQDGQSVPMSKLNNIARALAWWISKDAVSLTVFKPVDFAVIQPQTRNFFELFFYQLFVSSQSTSPLIQDPPVRKGLDAKALEKEPLQLVFKKTSKISTLTQGLLYIIPSIFKKKARDDEFLSECIDIAKNTLRSGLSDLDDL